MPQTKKKIKLDPDCTEEAKEHMYYSEEEEEEDEDEAPVDNSEMGIVLDPDCMEEAEAEEDLVDDDTDEDEDEDEDEDDELLSNRTNMESAYWSPRMELFSVYVKLNKRESLDKLFGAITLVDCRSAVDIFDPRTGITRASKSYPGWTELILTGPNRHIESDDYSCVLMRLTKNKSLLEPHKERGPKYYWHLPRVWEGVTWDSMGGRHDSVRLDINQHLTDFFEPEFGRVFMEYALLSSAMGAIVEVQLDTINNNDAVAYVYGTITARTTDLEGCERVLFCKTELAAEKVKPGDLIPLTRRSVSGTFGSRFEICLDLWNHNDIGLVQKIVSSKFKTERMGNGIRINVKSLSGSFANINVKVRLVR